MYGMFDVVRVQEIFQVCVCVSNWIPFLCKVCCLDIAIELSNFIKLIKFSSLLISFII